LQLSFVWNVISKHKSAIKDVKMSGVWISNGGSRPEKIPFIQTLTHIKKFFCIWSLR